MDDIITKNKKEIKDKKANDHSKWVSKEEQFLKYQTTEEFQKYKILCLLNEAKRFEYNVLDTAEKNGSLTIKTQHLDYHKQRWNILKQKYKKYIDAGKYDDVMNKIAGSKIFSHEHILLLYSCIQTDLSSAPGLISLYDDIYYDDSDDDLLDMSVYRCDDTRTIYFSPLKLKNQ